MNYLIVLFYTALCALGIVSPEENLSNIEIQSLASENKEALETHNNQLNDGLHELQWD